jgi:hypothetical protein
MPTKSFFKNFIEFGCKTQQNNSGEPSEIFYGKNVSPHKKNLTPHKTK